jgi:hypothetical protein
MLETAVTSFVIRFRQERTDCNAAPPWRGLIRHIQSSEEIHFTNIEDALRFMAQFVEITQPAENEDRQPQRSNE